MPALLRPLAALVMAAAVCFAAPSGVRASAVTPDSAEGRALVERLRAGGLVMFFRHADTAGMPCDSLYRLGQREGQRNISEAGRAQSRALGAAIAELNIPVARPVLAGPVFRARDTAELAFGAEAVEVTDSLLADDYAGGRLSWILDEHRRLFSDPVPAGANRVLVGHRTPAIMVMGQEVAGDAFPEGAALVMQPHQGESRDGGGGRDGDEDRNRDEPKPEDAALPELLGVLLLAPPSGDGFHDC